MIEAYAFDLKLVCGGYYYFSTYTIGSAPNSERSFPSEQKGLEFRTPDTVFKERFSRALQDMGHSYAIVKDEAAFFQWTCIQGWALVEIDFAEKFVPHWLQGRECMISPLGSFTDIALASPKVRERMLRGKFRKRILNRDGNKCLLCGSTANLTLQHVVPYSKGGETSYRNLVTLCGPCNQSFSDHTDRDLYDLAELSSSFEYSLLRGGIVDEKAIIRAGQVSFNIMYTRGELY